MLPNGKLTLTLMTLTLKFGSRSVNVTQKVLEVVMFPTIWCILLHFQPHTLINDLHLAVTLTSEGHPNFTFYKLFILFPIIIKFMVIQVNCGEKYQLLYIPTKFHILAICCDRDLCMRLTIHRYLEPLWS